MNKTNSKRVLIFGATGHMGGAAARELLKRDWQVRAVTRNPNGEKARALARLGAELCQADMDDRASLEAAFDGYQRVFSLQSWTICGPDGEVRQGKLVAEVARAAQIKHLVYGSAGTGRPDTGVPHFQSKIEVEAYMRQLGLPFTVVRPGPFMELLVAKEFFPALGFWGTAPRVVGWDLPIPWVAVDDIGMGIANIFEDPDTWLGSDIELFGDVKSLAECREVFVATGGRKPFRVPLPPALFAKMAGDEFVLMWRWMIDWIGQIGPEALWQTVEASREVCPDLHDMESWLKLARNGRNGK